MTPESLRPRAAIVLAGRRARTDPLAEAAQAPHRALLPIEGEPMLLRVVRRLLARPGLERVLVNIDAQPLLEDHPACRSWLRAGRIETLASSDSPSQSVLESLAQLGLDAAPILVTTADHALLDDAILDAFLSCAAERASDLVVGLVARRTIEARFPDARRTYLAFRNEAYSGANLFLFRTPTAHRAAEFWKRVEKERKRPWRIARAFGYLNLALFLTRRLDLDTAFARASQVVGARIVPAPLPIAEAAVDVDKLADLELVRRILAERRAATADE